VWLVVLLSFVSKTTATFGVVGSATTAKPLLLADVVTQPCTVDVTSNATYCEFRLTDAV
jgi:hypothetical protein